ncbi:amidohydrolase [Bacillaceae bacterium SIJ1]|uniref:amidohydrolase n=1 Tax=Litoribacterium kuwaitense TaxID=1398745 RepID=UPI0013ECD4C7|nr:amidohydrolase [Litoribacterium kuwaitense]NGP44178.1 amidohydrolase [Litoribacterium kuwaitense]
MKRLWFGGPIYTMAKPGEKVEAVLTVGDQIVGTGDQKALGEAFDLSDAEAVNLHGRAMYPGFVDSHLHMIGYGEQQLRLDLSELSSSRSVIQKLIHEVETTTDEWVIADGLNENNWTDRQMMSLETLDAISPYRPMVLHRVCKHAMLVNRMALQRAGIDKDTPDPPGGVIGRFPDGRLNGWLYDSAQDIMKQTMPRPNQAYVERALRVSVEKLLSLGLTGGHTEDLAYYHGLYPTLSAFKKVIDGERLAFRTQLLVNHLCFEERERFEGPIDDHGHLEWGPIKIFADGALGGRTAWLSHPYADDNTTNGVAIHSEDELERLVQQARSVDKTVAIHAIGDQALAAVIDVLQHNPPPAGEVDRIIHASLSNEKLIAQMQTMPVGLDLQPQFVLSDFPWVLDRIGDSPILLYPWKTYLDRGLRVAGGSDAPIETPDPREGIYAAVARRKKDSLHDGYIPQEKLSMYEAISLYTTGSAWISGHAERRGKICPNYTADFSIFAADFFTMEKDPEAILANPVSETIVGGRTYYQA